MERKTKERIAFALDSTPLIYLFKASLIRKLAGIATIVITNSVYREVVIGGKKVGASEVEIMNL